MRAGSFSARVLILMLALTFPVTVQAQSRPINIAAGLQMTIPDEWSLVQDHNSEFGLKFVTSKQSAIRLKFLRKGSGPDLGAERTADTWKKVHRSRFKTWKVRGHEISRFYFFTKDHSGKFGNDTYIAFAKYKSGIIALELSHVHTKAQLISVFGDTTTERFVMSIEE